MRKWIENFLTAVWYHGDYRGFVYLTLPLSWIYHAVALLRRKMYEIGLLTTHRLPVPVIVVGNISVGGTGKTPLVIWIANFLMHQGYSPCIISRGYGGRATMLPQQVRTDSDPRTVGDEPILLATRCKCPVAVSPDRAKAGNALLEHKKCDVIICDDGLQHYALDRDIEIAVIDGVRRFGNRHLLPAGPLREPARRLRDVDIIVANGLADRGEFSMKLREVEICNMSDPRLRQNVEAFRGKTMHAVTGIGNPERFFAHLKRIGIKTIQHSFPDHHMFTRDEILFDDGYDVIMTEKDAVRIRSMADRRHWYLKVDVDMQEHFSHRLLMLLDEVKKHG